MSSLRSDRLVAVESMISDAESDKLKEHTYHTLFDRPRSGQGGDS